ncbi:MAG: hypothetical protein RL077_813 [Verrucomicrobiota bacterium]|jgi:mono/diheme cytochrome c family protein
MMRGFTCRIRPTPLAGAPAGRLALVLGASVLGGCFGPSTPAVTSEAKSAASLGAVAALSTAEFDRVVKPLLKGSCVECHNPTRFKGKLDLERFLTASASDALQHRELWETVISRVRTGEMPPEDEPRPPAEQLAAATKWIEGHYAQVDRAAPLNPGRLTARRLNRVEYNNTVRDLLGVNLRFADDFPPDPEGHGFDNNADVLSLSPVLTEKYLSAAEAVAQAAIPGTPPPSLTARYDSQVMGQRLRLHIQTTHHFPVDARYKIRLGWEQGNPEGSRYTGYIYIDGKEVLKQPVVFKTYQDRSIYLNDVLIPQGTRRVEARMEVAPASEQPRGGRPRPPYPTVLEISGPFNGVSKEQTESYRRIFFAGPPTAERPAAYAREIFARLLPRAFRRPVTKSEVDQIVKLSDLVRSRGSSFEEGIRVGLTAMLMSPHFLFRIERDPKGTPDGAVYKVSDPEFASRLSYFLWRSMPDDALLALAEQRRLHEPDVLKAQVQRMLADPKGYSLASDFAGQWLQIRNLETNIPDRGAFPDYDLPLRDAMRTETELFFQAMIGEDRNVLDLLDGNFTFLNERLAKHYGIPGVEGREFRRVELPAGERGGVITHASVLTVTSYPTRTSPVIRGKWMLETILNAPPPPPPPNVPTLDSPAVGKTVSLRQQLEKHRASAECATCHNRMDPLGLALENYDGIGRWRMKEGEVPIDASGRLPNGTTFSGGQELKAILRADAPRFIRSLSEKMLMYALGRGLEIYDRPAIEQVARRVEQNEGRMSELIAAVIESTPFQMRRRDAAPIASAELPRPVHSMPTP